MNLSKVICIFIRVVGLPCEEIAAKQGSLVEFIHVDHMINDYLKSQPWVDTNLLVYTTVMSSSLAASEESYEWYYKCEIRNEHLFTKSSIYCK